MRCYRYMLSSNIKKGKELKVPYHASYYGQLKYNVTTTWRRVGGS